MSIVNIRALDGTAVSFEDKVIGRGGMKDVYFSQDKRYVVAFFRDKQDQSTKDRLTAITSIYREGIFNQAGGDYWKNVFCWPEKIVEYNGLLGLVVPVYQKHFYFEFGSREGDSLRIKGMEKEGKWFASPFHQNWTLDIRESGNWLSYFRICIQVCRAVRRMHAAGLAHSDLSYKNILIDPSGGNTCIIDIDSLVVPGKYPPMVVGTPDFIAPEVMKTRFLPFGDSRKFLPDRQTDQHALAVLIYMYLMYRHPLRGCKFYDSDNAEKDEFLSMGEKALFIENPDDRSNRYSVEWIKTNRGKRWVFYIPWGNLDKLPYQILGPYLSPLISKAFIEGLHNPSERPTANDWETALVKTVDLVIPCRNASCKQKWFVFDEIRGRVCPFCDTSYNEPIPVLHFYSRRNGDKLVSENHRLVVYHNMYMYRWHVNRNVFPNEHLADSEKNPVGYFVFHEGDWYLVNQNLRGMKDLEEDKIILLDRMVMLRSGKRIHLSSEEGGRVIEVQMICK